MSFNHFVQDCKQIVDNHIDDWLFISNLPAELIQTITKHSLLVHPNGFIQLKRLYHPNDHLVDTRDLPAHDHEGREAQFDHNSIILHDLCEFLIQIRGNHIYSTEEVEMGLPMIIEYDYNLVLENRHKFRNFIPMSREELRMKWFDCEIRSTAYNLRLNKVYDPDVPAIEPC